MRKAEVIGLTLLAIMFVTGLVAAGQQVYWEVNSDVVRESNHLHIEFQPK